MWRCQAEEQCPEHHMFAYEEYLGNNFCINIFKRNVFLFHCYTLNLILPFVVKIAWPYKLFPDSDRLWKRWWWWWSITVSVAYRGVARIFQRGGHRGYSLEHHPGIADYIWFIPLLSLVYQQAQSYYRGMKALDNSRWRKHFTKQVGFSTMAFTAKILSWCFRHLNIVGSCLLKRRPTKGGSRAPQDPPPLATPLAYNNYCTGVFFFLKRAAHSGPVERGGENPVPCTSIILQYQLTALKHAYHHPPSRINLFSEQFISEKRVHTLIVSIELTQLGESKCIHGEKLARLGTWFYHHKKVNRLGGSPF